MRLEALTEPELIFPGLRCSDASSVLRLLARKIVEHGVVGDSSDLYEKLWEREQLGSTAIGTGVAIPHCKMPGLDRVQLAIGLLDEGIDFAAVDEQPVHVFFRIVSPEDSPAAHLQCLAAISKWIKTDRHIETLRELRDPEAIYRLFQEGEED